MRFFPLAILALHAPMALPGLAIAQVSRDSVAGVVIDERAQPVEAARVTVPEIRGAEILTNAAGRFVIRGLSGDSVTLRVIRVGFAPVTRRAGVNDGDIRVGLTKSAVTLDDIVVTGTGGREVEKRELGNSVAQIYAEDVLESAPVTDVASLINGRAQGVALLQGSGQVGAGPNLQLRGATTFSLNGNPLIYIDGVRVDNETGSGISVQGAESGVVNRLNDINPDEIESIEIVRGPAAATLYGTEASAGVVQIITKKGRASDRPQFDVTVRQGATWFADAEGRVPRGWGTDANGQPVELNAFESERARGNKIFRTGHYQDYALAARGRSSTFQYYVSGGFERDEGIELPSALRRGSARGNLTFRPPGGTYDATLSFSLTRGRSDQSCEGGCGGVMFSLVNASPLNLDTPFRGFLRAPPEAFWQTQRFFQDYDRTTLSLQVSHRPLAWLSHRLTVGADFVHEDNEAIVERIEDPELAQFFTASFAEGSKELLRRDVLNQTIDYSASASFDLLRKLRSTTTVGAQYYTRRVTSVDAFGTAFPAPGVDVVSGAALTEAGEGRVKSNTLGLFVQQQFGIANRLFVSGAVRADDNSAFGRDYDMVYYPKASLSWIAREEGVGFLNSLKLRAAYGAAGRQPFSFAAVRSFDPVTAGGGLPALTPGSLGNDSLAPERGEEFEAGFEAGLFRGKLGLDVTFYDRRTTDALLIRQVPPSLGFPGEQWVNAGSIKNRGVEGAMTALIGGPSFGVDLQLRAWKNDNEVQDLGGADQGLGFIEDGRQRHVPGLPVGGWWVVRVTSAELTPEGDAINILCDAGQADGRAGGPAVSCDDEPRIFVGSPFPDFGGSFLASFRLFKNFRISGLLDWQTGAMKINNDYRGRCAVRRICRENFFPQEYDPRLIAELQEDFPGISGYHLDDADFARLREVSLTMDLPRSLMRALNAGHGSISLAARNVKTWTSFSGLDPEAQFTEFGFFNLQQAATPQLTRFVTTLNLSF